MKGTRPSVTYRTVIFSHRLIRRLHPRTFGFTVREMAGKGNAKWRGKIDRIAPGIDILERRFINWNHSC